MLSRKAGNALDIILSFYFFAKKYLPFMKGRYKFTEDVQNTDIESVALLSVRCKNFKMKWHKKVEKKSDEK